MSEQIDVLELDNAAFADSRLKNRLLSQSTGDYIGFLKKEDAGREEILDIYTENPFLKEYDAVIFGENIPEGETDLCGMITSCSMCLFCMVIKRDLFADIGCFNEKLSAGINYEFLCRCAAGSKVYCVPCASETKTADGEDGRQRDEKIRTIAYVLRHHMTKLKDCGRLEEVLGTISGFLAEKGFLDTFHRYIRCFLDEEKEYEQIAGDTAPIFIISGDETCYGVLNDFANMLADELVRLGQSVVTTNGRYGEYTGPDIVEHTQFKALIGFQAPVLEKDLFRNAKGKKMQFWFDNPAFFNDMFKHLSDDYYFLCQDKFYAEHLQHFYSVKNAIQFPPAGRDRGYADNEERPYDVVFIGTYYKNDMSEEKEDLKKMFYRYMLNHPRETFESGLRAFFAEQNLRADESKFLLDLWYMKDVCKDVINYYRGKVIETILSADILLHVYGDSWKCYEGPGKENLIIHPAVSVEESLEILGKAKVGLNVMTWHKAGMTERIANIMLSGAVCLSDETVYLREHFTEDEEIVLFDLDRLGELPGKICRLLEDKPYRRGIAKRAYQNAAANHTWRQRAEELLEIMWEA